MVVVTASCFVFASPMPRYESGRPYRCRSRIGHCFADEAVQCLGVILAADAAAAELRVAVLRDLVLLDLTRDARHFAAEFIRGVGVPEKAKIDALHIAVAAVHGMDYLVSWNCTHIANATMCGRIEAICRGAGFDPPVICTPLELVKEQTL